MRSPRVRLLALGMIVLAGCAGRWPLTQAAKEPERTPLGLVTDGSAFTREGMREDVRRAIAEATGRPVVLLELPPHAAEGGLQRLGSPPAGERSALAESRERACGAGGTVLAGISAGVAGVYQVTVDYTVSTRPVAPAEQDTAHALTTRFLGLIGLADTTRTRDEVLTGRVRLLPFTGRRGLRAEEVSRSASRVAPTRFTESLDIAAAVAEAAKTLRAPDVPDWAAFGGALASGGCPLTALWIADGRMADGPETVRLRGVALAAIDAARRPRRPPEPVASTVADVDAGYSCRDLCGLHMVELCNSDRVLWDYNSTRWEPTACGTKRSEPFLQTCYEQQWQSGTYFNACLLPCQGTAEGRARLVKILESSGCLRRSS